jgi:flagellar protein FlgJ
VESSALYSDFGAMADLRYRAVQGSDSAVQDVAEQFESLFVQMMLKSMRDATIDGGLFSSNQMSNYQQMYDKQLSVELSSNGGLGLARVLVTELQGGTLSAPSEGAEPGTEKDPTALANPAVNTTLPSAAEARAVLSLGDYRGRALPVMMPAFSGTAAAPLTGPPEPAGTPAPSAPAATQAASWSASSPAEFVALLRPLAAPAAQKLGVDPDVLIAQAALETGWGQRMSADASGPSFNLFNIKAGSNWSGRTVSVPTLEYRDGIAQREMASFRAYDSPADSLEDYVQLISSSPRYREAMGQAADADQYLAELQQAGYATDPAYADKVLSILEHGSPIGLGAG